MKTKITNVNLSIKFPVDKVIRRNINTIEDLLQNEYQQPTVIPVSDEMDPAIPRVQFQSKGGHSTVFFSQQSVDFSVNFDANFWHDFNACLDHVQKKISLLIEVLDGIKKDVFYYSGITVITKSVYESDEEAKENFDGFDVKEKGIYDYEYKTTRVVNDIFFINVQNSNYREYSGDIFNFDNQFLVNFSKASVFERGIQKIIDVNDRYLYNISGNYYNKEELVLRLKLIFDLLLENIKEM